TGKSPAGLDASLVEALPGSRIPERHPLSVTVPGAVRGWWDLHQRYGKLDWSVLFDDAIECAEQGYILGRIAASEWKLFDFALHAQDECAQLYQAGNPPAAGTQLNNKELAGVLKMIKEQGPDPFYEGWIPKAAGDAV